MDLDPSMDPSYTEKLTNYKDELMLNGGLRDMIHVLRDDGYNKLARESDPRVDIITLIQLLCMDDERFLNFVKVFRGITAIKSIAQSPNLPYPLSVTAWNAMAQLDNSGPHA